MLREDEFAWARDVYHHVIDHEGIVRFRSNGSSWEMTANLEAIRKHVKMVRAPIEFTAPASAVDPRRRFLITPSYADLLAARAVF